MNWRELIDTDIELDEVDNRAIHNFNEWAGMYENGVTREDFIRKSYDPDILNEFCYYPMEHWGRLIEWAKDFYDKEDISYQYRMIRAAYLLTHVDPSMIQFADTAEELDPEYPGPYFVKQMDTAQMADDMTAEEYNMGNIQSALNELDNMAAALMFGDEGMGDLDDLLESMSDDDIPFNFNF